MRRRQLLTVVKTGDELQRGREKLHEADRRQCHALGSYGEKQERQDGHRTAEDQQSRESGIAGRERRLLCRDQPRHPERSNREQKRRLDKQSRHCANCDLLATHAVGREQPGQRQRDPGKSASAYGQKQHAKRRKYHSNDLQPSQALTEQYDTNTDVHQGIDVVAKTRLEYALILDGPDVDEPVDGNAQGRQG